MVYSVQKELDWDRRFKVSSHRTDAKNTREVGLS